MAVEVVIPQAAAGEGMELTLARWLKQEGEQVRGGEPLFELDTDKATLEIEAVGDGVLGDIRAREGDGVEPLEVVAYLLEPGETPPSEPALPRPARPPRGQIGPPAGTTPKARELANEYGIDLSTLAGTGAGGFITTKDVEAAIAERDTGSGG